MELPTLEILTTGSEGVQCLGFSTTVVFILNLVFSLKFDDFLPYFYLQSLGPLLGGFPTWCNKNTRAPIKMDWKSCVTTSARMRRSSKPWRRIISMVPQQLVVERLDRMLPRPGPWPPRSGKVRPHGNCLKRLTISGISIADFDSGNTIPNCMNMFFLIFPSKKNMGGDTSKVTLDTSHLLISRHSFGNLCVVLNKSI